MKAKITRVIFSEEEIQQRLRNGKRITKEEFVEKFKPKAAEK